MSVLQRLGCAAAGALLACTTSQAIADDSIKVLHAPSPGELIIPSVKDHPASFKVVANPFAVTQAAMQNQSPPQADEPIPSDSVDGPPTVNNDNMRTTGDRSDGFKLSMGEEQNVNLATGSIRDIKTRQSFTKVVSGNVDIFEILPISDHELALKANKTGNASVMFYDDENKLMGHLEVHVDDFVLNKARPKQDTETDLYGKVDVHNKALLTSQTNFRCKPNHLECVYVGETTVSEPAPLPRGNTMSTVNNINSTK